MMPEKDEESEVGSRFVEGGNESILDTRNVSCFGNLSRHGGISNCV